MKKEILELQQYMQGHHYDAFLVETADEHQSEYVGDYYKVRSYLSGFTGSAGTLLVTLNRAYLWTDGRYFIQAENELKDSGIMLMRMGQKGVETLEEVLGNLASDMTLGLDMRMVSDEWLSHFKASFPKASVMHDPKVFDELWLNRPKRSCTPVWDYDVQYCGVSRQEKIKLVKQQMAKKGALGMLVGGLDDVSWLLNLRGHDVTCNPVALSFVLIDEKHTTLYIQKAALSEDIVALLEADGITLRPYEAIYDDLELYDSGTLWIDPKKTNAALVECLNPQIPLLKEDLPIALMKAIKNPIEIACTKQAHIYDGVAVTKWMYWLKKTIKERDLDELEVQDYLEKMRAEQPGYIEPSFSTICAYNANAAMMHYQATKENYATIQAKGMLLVDSGGQYLKGTTDITRTLILGEVPDVFKKHFTLALRSMLRLQSACFLEGCTGLNLDILARGPLWDLNLDYQCGTGHGVGHLLNVHEGPNGFRWKVLANRNEMAVLKPGMITTNEPGVYIEGSHGVRHENELLCVFKEENAYGRFLTFEPITYAPIDLEGVQVELLEKAEKEALNQYHALVYQTLAPYLEADVQAWLKDITRAL